jgi:hypothetical protein
LDALELVVRDVEAEFNRLNVGGLPLTFAFGGRECEEMQACPAIGWDEPDGDISGEPSKSVAGTDSIMTMQPRSLVKVWFGDRETARAACFLLMAAAREVPTDHGTVEFDRYEVKGAGSAEHATLGFIFTLQARVKLPVPRNPIPVTTEVIVKGHTFAVSIGDGDADESDDELVASGERPLP